MNEEKKRLTVEESAEVSGGVLPRMLPDSKPSKLGPGLRPKPVPFPNPDPDGPVRPPRPPREEAEE